MGMYYSTYTNQLKSTDFQSMNLSSCLSVAYLESLLPCFGIIYYILHLCLIEWEERNKDQHSIAC